MLTGETPPPVIPKHESKLLTTGIVSESSTLQWCDLIS
jgi:hypothetical protein